MRSIVLATLLCAASAHAQAPGTSVKFSPDKGVVVKSDSTFQLTIRFRIQERVAFLSKGGDDLDVASTDMRVRRARLRFDGFLITPRLQYKLQFGFSKADMDILDGTQDQYIVRDALLTYALSKQWTIGLGQAKLPGLRQQVISSNQMELPDRSIVNAAFTLDRDFGVFGNWQRSLGNQVVRFRGAISTGEGRSANVGDDGLCYTGRVEWLPFGTFTSEGDYFEGDLEHEPKPKLSVGGTYSVNQHALRNNGQLGEAFGGGQERTIHTAFADVLFKYNGWSLASEYAHRAADGTATAIDPVSHRTELVHEGDGLNTQVGRMLGQRDEVVGRYSLVSPSDRVQALYPRREEAWLGYDHYLNQHRVKLQAALSYTFLNGTAALDHAGNYWGLWFQVELGI